MNSKYIEAWRAQTSVARKGACAIMSPPRQHGVSEYSFRILEEEGRALKKRQAKTEQRGSRT